MLKIILPAASRAFAALTLTALLAGCQSGPPKVEYATSLPAPIADIPMRMLLGKPYVEVQINGKGPYLLEFDTGAALALTRDAATELGIREARKITITGNANKAFAAYEGDVGELSLAGFVLRNQPVMIHDFKLDDDLQKAYATPPIIGYIGRELYHNWPSELDFAANRLRLYPPGTPMMQASDHVERIGRNSGDNLLITINGSLGKEDTILDTGVRGAYHHSGKVNEYSRDAIYVQRGGVDGGFMSEIHRIGQLQLFGQTLQQPLIESRLTGAYYGGHLLGNACLRGLRLKIDWEQRLLGVNGQLPDTCANPYGQSGILAYKSDAGFYVLHILPESAVRAGVPNQIRHQQGQGAILSKINGKPATTFSQAEFDAINAGQEGRAMSIEFQGYTGSFYVLFDKPEQSGTVAAK